MLKYFAATILLLSIAFTAFGQTNDSVIVKKSGQAVLYGATSDIEQFQSEDTTHSPRLAALYSAVLPGAGQFYNKKYWKIPIIYALGAFAAYQIKSNHQAYMLFRNVNFTLGDADPTNDAEVEIYKTVISEEGIVRRVEAYKRDRDYWIILSGVFYALNIVDAVVDAHLREFSLNENLSMRVEPSVKQDLFQNMQAGVMLNFRIKGKKTN